MKWSDQQEAIFKWFEGTDSHRARALVTRARAGTGKTTTILEGINRAPERSIMLSAFNKSIAVELQQKLKNPYAEAKTLHAYGYSIIRRFWKKADVDTKRTNRLAQAVAGNQAPDEMVMMISKLATKAKEMAPLADKPEDLYDLAEEFDCIPDSEWEEDGWDLEAIAAGALAVMELSKKADGTVDYADMLFLPIAQRWARGKYDLVVIDECFVGDTPILLADKTTRTIKELVEARDPVNVLSYNIKTGKQEPQPIIGFNSIPLRKRTLRIKIQQKAYGKNGQELSLKMARVKYGQRALVCTEDHRIWTGRGWMEAKYLKVGDIVQVESDAPRDKKYNNKYKHSTVGRKRLSELLAKRDMPTTSSTAQRPPIRGGNGQGLTLPQKLLLAELGDRWVPEFIIMTGPNRPKGTPYHYKIDLANPECKIAIEIDGKGHRTHSRREADARKDLFLASLGWTVHRYSNVEAVRRTAEIANSLKGCPVDGIITEIGEYETKDLLVYDLTIEGTHTYYAHGILVHNCQDMNVAQVMLARKSVCEGGRLAVVGDDRQSIYSFRGADSGVLDRIAAETKADQLKLTTTYRCPKNIVALAQKRVPDYTAAETAPDGEVFALGDVDAITMAQPGDFLLSRKNAPLVGFCLRILRSNKRARIQGRDIGAGLQALVRKWKVNSMPEFLKRLKKWEEREVARAEAAGLKNSESRIEKIQDQADTLRSMSEGLSGIRELQTRIESLFADDGTPAVVCSSIHRIKGLESDRVFVLKSTLRADADPPCECGHFAHDKRECKRCGCGSYAPDKAKQQEERNLMYVAVTRSKNELHWVTGDF